MALAVTFTLAPISADRFSASLVALPACCPATFSGCFVAAFADSAVYFPSILLVVILQH